MDNLIRFDCDRRPLRITGPGHQRPTATWKSSVFRLCRGAARGCATPAGGAAPDHPAETAAAAPSLQ
jgi:hypothetical protein